MNFLAVLVVGSSLIAVAGLPIVTQQPAPLLATESPLKLVATDDFAARKDDYLRRTRTEMDEWRNKLHNAGEHAEAQSHETGASAKARLNRAWTVTQRSWRRLQMESAEGWNKSKVAYERSTQELREQWHKIHPEDGD